MATDGRMFWRLILKLTISIDKMIAHAIFFYTFSIIAVVSAIMVTASKNTVHSVFFLILDFISISCLFIMIGAEFLGMIMLIVYVGAVAVLFLFVVMMLNVAQQKNQWFAGQATSKHIPVGLIISTLIFFEIIIVIGGWKYKPEIFDINNSLASTSVSNTHSLGQVLYTDYIHVFQITLFFNTFSLSKSKNYCTNHCNQEDHPTNLKYMNVICI